MRTSTSYNLQGDMAVYVLVYVDDLLIFASNPYLSHRVLHSLSHQFPVKDLGPANYFLGVKASTSSEGIALSQAKYIRDLAQKVNIHQSKSVTTPMATNLSLDDSPLFPDVQLYRSIVGSLQYLSFTRPDVSFAVNKVCQFMHSPQQKHWQAVKRIIRYLNSTTDLKFILKSNSPVQRSIFTDADWAGDPLDRRSTRVYCVYLGDNLNSWSSKKQPTVSRLSTEAEYRALANATCEALWLQYLLAELHISLTHAPTLWCDNLGVTYLAVNPVLHHRVKHLGLDYHFVRERV